MLRNDDEISYASWRSYFSFLQGVKSENSELFKDFFNAVKMEKNKSGCVSYFVIIPTIYKNHATSIAFLCFVFCAYIATDTSLMIIFILIVVGVSLAIFVFLQQPKFGKLPAGERLERIEKSPHYKNGTFRNVSNTPSLTEGASYYSVMKEIMFGASKRRKPADSIPTQKTDLLALPADKDILVWFGHSSYFIQVDGRKILVDPVFSGAASPIKSTTRSFPGADVYTTDDLPEIDYLFISHDHWDHLDYETILKIKPKVKKVICAIGVGAHLEFWGFDKNVIIEKDWNQEAILENGFIVNTTTARHFSGRGLKRNKSIWLSFALKTPTMNIFIGGDSGYDVHFRAIGDKYGPFDLAILECGQYDKSWKYIHMMPEEVVTASQELKAKRLMPVHWGKFALANHAWDDSITRVTRAAQQQNVALLTPMIGEEVCLKNIAKVYPAWWANIQ